MTELLSPAGNYDKLLSALRYGADAVYLAGKEFGMRSAADNFTLEELQNACALAHGMGRKIYLTLNTLPRTNEYKRLGEYISEVYALSERPDAFIIADAGVFSLAKRLAPGTEIHISTQAGIVSAESCLFWRSLGAKRAVLARELSLEDIKDIRKEVPEDFELEVFVHGSMCVSFSGRCLLSNALTGRDGNRGMCAQPCRWNYTITEEKRQNMPIPVEQTGDGTFIMSSKDMCMAEHMPELIKAGITSFKIEGRMKSAYYTAVVTNVYRTAIDGYNALGEAYVYDKRWTGELLSVSHREYSTGYFFSSPSEDANVCTMPGYIRDKAFLAIAEKQDREGLYKFVQKNKLSVGDRVELVSPRMTGRGFTVTEIYDEALVPIESVPQPKRVFYLKVPFEVLEGDILRGEK